MPAISPIAMKRTDVTAAIALLLIAEATLFFTFLFIIGPIAMLTRLLPLVVVLVLCTAWYWGQDWARGGLLVPVALRVGGSCLWSPQPGRWGGQGLRCF